VVMEQVGVYEWDDSIERRMVIFSVNIYRLKYKKRCSENHNNTCDKIRKSAV